MVMKKSGPSGKFSVLLAMRLQHPASCLPACAWAASYGCCQDSRPAQFRWGPRSAPTESRMEALRQHAACPILQVGCLVKQQQRLVQACPRFRSQGSLSSRSDLSLVDTVDLRTLQMENRVLAESGKCRKQCGPREATTTSAPPPPPDTEVVKSCELNICAPQTLMLKSNHYYMILRGLA